MEQEYKYGELTSQIIAAAMEVHRSLGCGFMEIIYQKALEIEFNIRKIPAIREVSMPIYYKGEHIGTRRVDFFADGKVCIELKAVSNLEDVHIAQALNYLEAFNVEIGMLLNFGNKSMQVKRLLNKKFDPLQNFNPNKIANK